MRILVGIAAFLFSATSLAQAPASGARVVLKGYDPVAYFTMGAATLGKSEHEYGFAGATWRFRNAGNRLAFIADSEVYGPRFPDDGL